MGRGTQLCATGGLLLTMALQTASADEVTEARRWVAAKLEGAREERPLDPGLYVLANNDPVQQNARGGKRMRMGEVQYTWGLYCHAYSRVIVRLPGPGKAFTAVAGVDTNDQTSGGRGSVIFVVRVGGKEAFRTDVRREGMPPVPVSVDLDGASEFVLEVEDAGDGIACDQSDWADAKVEMEDGSVVWLGDMALFEGARKGPYTTDPFFSFTYDGKPSAELLRTWERKRETARLDAQRTQHTLTYTDPQTGLVVRCVGIEYHDFPTVEWTLYLKNTSDRDTPILSDIQAVDTRFERNAQGEFTLNHHVGSPCTQYDYQPLQTVLGPRQEKRVAAAGGRPTNSDLPYFNLEWPGEGVIVVVGWPGQWAATFTRDADIGTRIRAGQELTHLKLLPGEEIRTPLVVLQFWQGDRLRAQNVWRRWMVAHSIPRPGGKLPAPQFAACSSHQFGEMIHADSASQIFFIDRYLEEGLKLDYWWMDAGWYWNKTGWPNTGTWEVDTDRFPGGFRPITDHAHEKGVRSIVWFEPERVTPGTWLYENHPEWLLGQEGGQKLLNLGNREAREWLTGHVDKLLTEQGIDLYRQDFNMDPLDYWRASDSAERQGITEIRHVEGYLAYWDELRRRHPDMLIDSCASGGRRNDLETMRRAVPLLRSDYILEPIGQQCHTYGIASWLPFWGTGFNATDAYTFRSTLCPHITGCYDMRRNDIDYASARKLLAEWRSVAPMILYGDYYPLTPYSRETSQWMAWQFDRPDEGDGLVQAFRRPDSVYEVARLRLRGLTPEATYAVRTADDGSETEVTGRDLMEPGIAVPIPDRPGAALLTYRRLESR
jgi:alpha-galactosidase